MSISNPVLRPDDAYNRALVQNVRPPEWTNPTSHGRYNLVVLGAGTAGLVSAAGAAALGARVALVEKHLMGGDCLNYGCVPSKALIRAARAAHAVAEASEYGVHIEGGARVDFPEVMERLRRVRAEISAHDSAQRFSKLGVDVFMGAAHFVDRSTIEVDGQRLSFSKAIIATGGRATALPVPGLAEAGFLTNETVFSLTALPPRLILIGAGPIGCELAQAFRRLGSEVWIVSDGSKVLPREDSEVSALLRNRFEREGIRLVLEAKLRRVERQGNAKQIVFDRGKGEEEVTADEILVATGRAPNVEGLGLDAAGIQWDAKGVKVDDRLRTSNPNIYAAGDVCSRYKFTHAAEAMARIAIQNALFFGRKRASSLVIPWCMYTDPEIAHVGLDSSEAQKRGAEIESFTLPLAEVDRSVVEGDTEGFARVHIERRSGRILGATLVSRHAGESIGELVLAITRGLSLGTLSGVIHPYPTQAEILKRLGDLSMRSRLRPWMKTLLTKVFEYRR